MSNYKLTKKNQTLTIFPISDVHYGNPHCDTEYYEFLLEKFKQTSGEKIIYLLGDECDVATKRQGHSSYDQKIDVNDQLEYIIKSLKPYKKYIRGIVHSNHMARTKKEFSLDISRIIAEALETPYCNNIYETITINDKPYTVYATHGTKTSQKQHLMMGAVERQTNHIHSNLFLYGHAHYCTSWSKPTLTQKGYQRRHYVLCGHMLNYFGSYAELNGLRPNPCGFTKINIDSNLRTTVDLYNKDECEEMI